MTTNRRTFLAALIATGAAPAIAFGRESANEQVRIGIVGLGIRGKSVIPWFAQIPHVRLVALCDPDQKTLDSEIAKLRESGTSVVGYTDVRKLLDSKEIDAVVIATPNHWHALMAIWALQAGKHVYLEKPVSHNLWEGWQLAAAARRYGLVVQTGTQNRSDHGLVKAVPYVRSGKLGDIKVIRGLCYNRRPSIGKVDGPQPIPNHIDYDLWSGPAPLKPLERRQLHYDWHWDFTYGNGDVGNQGIHEMDVCRWFLGTDEMPRGVVTLGGRLGYEDDGNTPNTLVTVLDYGPAPIVFEVRGLPQSASSNGMDHYRGQQVGVVVECEQGYFAGGRGGGAAYDNGGNLLERFRGDGGEDHASNFITAVREGNPSSLRAEVQEGVLSSALCHMANISYLAGSPTPPGEIAARLQDDPLARGAYEQMAEHLAANEIDLEATPLTLGPSLQWDAEQQKFAGETVANELLLRAYRSPFEVPQIAGS